MEIKWIEHKSKKVLFVDYRGAKNEDDLFAILQQDIEIEKSLNEKVPALVNYQDVFISQKYMNEVKKFGKEIRNEKISKTALLGIVGVKSVFVNAYIMFTGDKNTKIFDNEEDAKDWLIA